MAAYQFRDLYDVHTCIGKARPKGVTQIIKVTASRLEAVRDVHQLYSSLLVHKHEVIVTQSFTDKGMTKKNGTSSWQQAGRTSKGGNLLMDVDFYDPTFHKT